MTRRTSILVNRDTSVGLGKMRSIGDQGYGVLWVPFYSCDFNKNRITRVRLFSTSVSTRLLYDTPWGCRSDF